MRWLAAIALVLLPACSEQVQVVSKPACIIPVPLPEVGDEERLNMDLARDPCLPQEVQVVLWKLERRA